MVVEVQDDAQLPVPLDLPCVVEVGEDGVGLTKFDFLGIKNLTILADAVTRVKETRGIELVILTNATLFAGPRKAVLDGGSRRKTARAAKVG